MYRPNSVNLPSCAPPNIVCTDSGSPKDWAAAKEMTDRDVARPPMLLEEPSETLGRRIRLHDACAKETAFVSPGDVAEVPSVGNLLLRDLLRLALDVVGGVDFKVVIGDDQNH